MFLYIVASMNGLFKIGKASKINERVAQIKTASPVECAIFAVIEYDDINDLEKELHTKFKSKRVRGEWFALSKDDLLFITPSSEEIECLLNEMEAWGFFTLGASELLGKGAMAALYRMQSLTPYHNHF